MRMLNKCMNSRSWNSRRGFSLVLAVLILLFFVAFASYGFAETAVLSTIILLVGIGLFSCFVFCIVVEGRMYIADEKGITISYVCGLKKFYPWHVFPKIVVCDFDHATKYPSNCYLIIRLGFKDEFCGPLSRNKRYNSVNVDSWRGYYYTIFRPNKILFLGFSPERLEEIQKLSKLQVVYSFTRYGKELYEQRLQDGKWDK